MTPSFVYAGMPAQAAMHPRPLEPQGVRQNIEDAWNGTAPRS